MLNHRYNLQLAACYTSSRQVVYLGNHDICVTSVTHSTFVSVCKNRFDIKYEFSKRI